MRYFLILGWLLPFFAPAQVNIPPDVARYFLEQDDKAKILTKKDSLNTIEINNLKSTIDIKDQLITTYKQDSVTYNAVIKLREEENYLSRQEVKILKKEVRKQKILTGISIVGMIVVTLISLL